MLFIMSLSAGNFLQHVVVFVISAHQKHLKFLLLRHDFKRQFLNEFPTPPRSHLSNWSNMEFFQNNPLQREICCLYLIKVAVLTYSHSVTISREAKYSTFLASINMQLKIIAFAVQSLVSEVWLLTV